MLVMNQSIGILAEQPDSLADKMLEHLWKFIHLRWKSTKILFRLHNDWLHEFCEILVNEVTILFFIKTKVRFLIYRLLKRWRIYPNYNFRRLQKYSCATKCLRSFTIKSYPLQFVNGRKVIQNCLPSYMDFC